MSFGANLLRPQKSKIISLIVDQETSDIDSDHGNQKTIVPLFIAQRIDVGKTLLIPSKGYVQNYQKVNQEAINRRHHLCNTVQISDESNQIQRQEDSMWNNQQQQSKNYEQNLIRQANFQYQQQQPYSHDQQFHQSRSYEHMSKIIQPSKRKRLRKLVNVSNKVKIQNKQKKTFEIQQCSICLTDLSDKSQKKKGRLPCKHLFCLKCIIQSSKFSNRCPYCRTSYLQIFTNGKTIQVEQPQVNAQEYEDPDDQPCYICGRNDDFDRLLECQFCQYAYCHTYCDSRLRGQTGLPEQQWYCNSCQQMLRNRNRQQNNFQNQQSQSVNNQQNQINLEQEQNQ